MELLPKSGRKSVLTQVGKSKGVIRRQRHEYIIKFDKTRRSPRKPFNIYRQPKHVVQLMGGFANSSINMATSFHEPHTNLKVMVRVLMYASIICGWPLCINISNNLSRFHRQQFHWCKQIRINDTSNFSTLVELIDVLVQLQRTHELIT